MDSLRPPAGVDLSASITVVPANEASPEDLGAIFGNRGYTSTCQCQKFKFGSWADRRATSVVERVARLQAQTHCGVPDARTTSGLVAYLDGEPVGWCAVEPRTAYARLLITGVPWKDRDEDRHDDTVWAVVCFAVRAGYRRRGVSRALARATVDFARQRGARAIEGYPMVPEPGKEVTWGELNVGSRSVFADAGYQEVSRPTLRRVVMRIEFEA